MAIAELPNTPFVREVRDYIRDAHGDLLYNHSIRVFLWGRHHAKRLSWEVNEEVLFASAAFHDIGLTEEFKSSFQRFELDGADEARKRLLAGGHSQAEADASWLAVALHTTPEVPRVMGGVYGALTAGVEMDNMAVDYEWVTDEDREEVVAKFPRGDYKPSIVRAFADGNWHRADSTIGTVNRDVLEYYNPGRYPRVNYVDVILNCAWKS